MKWILLSSIALFFFSSTASADFSYVRGISMPPGSGDITGLDTVNGDLFVVTGLDGQPSCIFIIDPDTGDIIRRGCPDPSPPGWPGKPLDFVSCAFVSGDYLIDPLGTDGYWVGDAGGSIVRYHWNDLHGFSYAGHCSPKAISSPVGLAERDGLLYVLDAEARAIWRLKNCSGKPPVLLRLPSEVTDPTALCFYDGSWFIAGAGGSVIYEVNDLGDLVDTHELRSFSAVPLGGMVFVGDYLFAAAGEEILVLRFSDFGRHVNVPEGDSIVVTPLPDEIEITFPSVVDSGSLYVYVHDTDPCPVPEGVIFLPSFYEIITDASFEYIAQIALMTQSPLPPGINPDRIRIFRRPSGACQAFMDITVAPLELYPEESPVFRVRSRTLSEDDEFSFVVLAEDNRNPTEIVELKFSDLADAIDALDGSPPGPYQQMLDLLDAAHAAFGNHMSGRAARLVERIAAVAMATPEIPHIYIPDQPGVNLGGRIVARAHTLAFSIRHVVSQEQFGDAQGPAAGGSRGSLPQVVLSSNPSANGVAFTISPSSPETATLEQVSVRIYSVRGELIRTLAASRVLSGPMFLNWDGLTGSGREAEAGVYFIVVSSGGERTSRKIVLQR